MNLDLVVSSIYGIPITQEKFEELIKSNEKCDAVTPEILNIYEYGIGTAYPFKIGRFVSRIKDHYGPLSHPPIFIILKIFNLTINKNPYTFSTPPFDHTNSYEDIRGPTYDEVYNFKEVVAEYGIDPKSYNFYTVQTSHEIL